MVGRRVERDIDISLWGLVSIEERYWLEHAGPALDGEFSRLDFLARDDGATGTAREFYASGLPPGAHDIYFRDGIGNISTSTVSRRSDSVVVQLRPRYPLFGGWTTDFAFGWRQPLGDAVKVARGGVHVLATRFGPSITEFPADEVVVRVILPPGAALGEASTPMELETWYETRRTYLDLRPRTVVVLRRARYVPELNTPLKVAFMPSPLALLAKPALLTLVCAIPFALAARSWNNAAAQKTAAL